MLITIRLNIYKFKFTQLNIKSYDAKPMQLIYLRKRIECTFRNHTCEFLVIKIVEPNITLAIKPNKMFAAGC